ncbi:MAG: hypothetical protein IPH69_03875 [Bacteroidales bacterium]|nr:hypothetical protein [Bacteroidales bacterium]
MKKLFLVLAALLPGFFLISDCFAQATTEVDESKRSGALNLFVDCRSCDMNYTRQEIPYVNYVRDTKEAEVYLLVTNQPAGSGGQQYTLTYEGLGKYRGMNDTLVYTSNPDESNTQVRENKTNIMKMGLMRYVARTNVFNEVVISNNSEVEKVEVVDKWNNWVFELQTSPRFNAEESYNRLFFSNSVNISKITPDIKLEIEFDMNNNKQKFIEDDGTETVYLRTERRIDNLFVKSLNEHWSAGLLWDLGASTNENYKFNTEFLPSIEYDIFPYSEATHRQFRFLYSIGYQYNSYIDSTILNQTSEGLFKHELRMAYQVQKKWGSANISLTGSNYFHDFSKNKIELNGFMRLRIVKGLSLSVNGGVAYINDQLNLAKGDLSEAERLLRLKEQATNFSIQGGVSLTYTFGSIYNNIVNPRFGNGGGGGGGGGMY